MDGTTTVKRSRSLATRLLVFFIGAATLPMIAVGVFGLAHSYTIQRDQIETLQHKVAENAANIIDAYLEQIEDEMTLATRKLSLGTEESRTALLDTLMAYNVGFETLVLMDETGQEIAKTSRLTLFGPGDLDNRAGSPEFSTASRGARYLGPVSFSQYGEPLVSLAIPAINARDEIVGVLLAEVNLKHMWDVIARVETGLEGYAYVVDSEGKLIAHRDSSLVLQGQNLSGLADVRAALQGTTVPSSFTGLEGREVIGGYQRLQQANWSVLVEVPVQVAMVSIYQAAALDGAIIVVAIVLAGLLGGHTARLVVRPLRQLQESTEIIGGGDLTHRIGVQSRDEIGALAAAFNDMTDRLRGTVGSLEERGQELAARTRELEASQRVTFAASARTSPDELLNLVVNLIRDQFHLYHVQVYIVDEREQAAVLRQSTGFAGRRLLQRKHQIPLDRTALVTRAIIAGEPVVVGDTSADPDFLPNPLLPDTRSELVVPLKTGDRVVGVLDAQDREAGRFTPNMMTLFQAMADQVTFLFENSDLIERVTEHSRALTVFTDQLRTAADIARRLGAVLDPEQLLQQVVELIRSRFGLYHVHIYVLEAPQAGGTAGWRLVVRAGSGDVGRVLRERGHSIPFDHEKSFVARAVRTQETVMVTDTTVESDFLPNPLLPQTRSEMAVPLIAGDEVLGVLDVQDDQPGRFTQAERDTFITLAGQIATALQTAGLFAQIQARFRVSQALAGTQTEEDVLDAMMLVAGFSPQARAAICTLDQEAGELTAVVRRDEAFDSGVVSTAPPGTRLTALQFPLLRLVSPDESFVSSNLSLDERADPASREMAGQLGVASIAVLPITAGTEWLGMIVVSSEEEGFFDERRLHLYRSLAEQGAITLRAARLFDETQRAAEELREMDRLKSEFLANMSHELRTPLNSIIGYTEIMLMGISEMDPDTLEDVQAIHTNGRHLLRMINDVLDMAKIDAGRMELKLEWNHVDSLIDDATSAAAGLLTDKPVELIVEVEEGLPPIWGDRMRLDQILNNLISNAEKFTKEGSITLRAFADRGDGSDGDWICVEVEDTGIGIAEGDMEMVFDRFQQVDGSSTRVAGGTGLGLALTQQLVHMHGGTIEVQSQPGEGSTFTVRLPVRRQELSADERI